MNATAPRAARIRPPSHAVRTARGVAAVWLALLAGCGHARGIDALSVDIGPEGAVHVVAAVVTYGEGGPVDFEFVHVRMDDSPPTPVQVPGRRFVATAEGFALFAVPASADRPGSGLLRLDAGGSLEPVGWAEPLGRDRGRRRQAAFAVGNGEAWRVDAQVARVMGPAPSHPMSPDPTPRVDRTGPSR